VDRVEVLTKLNIRKEVLEAENRIRGMIRETPLEFSPFLSEAGQCRVYLKCENQQVSGSFKYRGAANLFLSLSEEERKKEMVTSSTGNHGAAFAHLLQKFGGKGTIYVPENAPSSKVDTLRNLRVDIAFHGSDCVDTEYFARQSAETKDQLYFPPYNHIKIVGGQGTVAVELERQTERTDVIFVPVGGGGLASGVAGYVKSQNQEIRIIGCQPVHSAVMFESIRAGKIVEMESKPTLSDGTAGGIEPGSITFDICQACIDDFILLTEEEIEGAIRLVLEKHHMLIEGAAALSVAAFLKKKKEVENKTVILILSGKRIGLETVQKILCGGA
jgi:threonine dehydratase